MKAGARTVCVVGSGAREHALASVLARSADVVVTPGNAGIEGRSPEGHSLTSTTAPAESVEADMYVIGPEAPLVAGLADRLRAAGKLVVGPGADGAQLEGSKTFMKDLCRDAGVPTARYATCSTIDEAVAFLRRLDGRYVVKTDGLAAGKGVLVTADLAEAEADVAAKLSGSAFGEAGRRVVVEEWLPGAELSLLVLCDGERAVPLAPAQDFKRLLDGDAGPNTGGMGAYSPVPLLAGGDPVGDAMERIVLPTVHALRAAGIDYRGVLYAGLMLTPDGPKLVEYNVRFGDPETQVVLPRMVSDCTDLLAAVAAGALHGTAEFTAEAAVCVVCAAPGYPEAPRTGDPIEGLAAAGTVSGVTVFHAGTARAGDAVHTAGGRALSVTGTGPTLAEARRRAYDATERISFPGMQFRRDIAAEASELAEAPAMIPRYSLPEMAALFTDEARFARWLEVELLATDAWAKLGVVPVEHALAIRERAPVVDAALVERIAERERVTDHDVAAFVDVVQEAVGAPEGSWVHHGLTSSDVVDTAWSATLTAAADLLVDAASGLVAGLKERAVEHRTTVMVGRTHGMHAEPTTFGVKLALFCLQVDRDRTRLRRAREAVAVGKLSGAVGTYSNIDPAVEEFVCASLGLRPVPATQVIARDRHAEYLAACASAGSTIEAIATEFRHLQRTEVGEVEEAFGAGQKGSSSMPHKRNPITGERLAGLARLLRGYLGAGLENVALWHERDISHSSVERVALPDASLLTYYMLRRSDRLVRGLVVDVDRMRHNLLEGSLGLVFSQPVLLALVSAGLTRDAAYRVVQRDARVAYEERRPFRAILEADPEVAGVIGDERVAAALDEAFDLERALRHAHRTIDALEAIEP